MISDQTHAIPRDLLAKYFGQDPRLVAAFENQALAVMDNTSHAIATTDALNDATVVTLSPNAAFNGEFVLGDGDGTDIAPDTSTRTVKINVDETVARSSGGQVTFESPGGAVTLGVPAGGTLVSDAEPGTLYKPRIEGLVGAGSDAAAASAGVPVHGVYHNGGVLRIRLT